MLNNLTILLVTFKPDIQILNNCLKSIENIAPIIIVDNGSTLSFKDIANFSDKENKIQIIKNKNVGNGEGINIGAIKSKTNYLLYLDVDTEVSIKTIHSLLKISEEISDVSVLAPNIENYIYKNENYKNKIPHPDNEVYEMNFVEGAIMLINKSNTYDIGITFDKNFFLYWEELDFFFQCHKKKKKILLIKNLISKHLGNSSTGKNPVFEIELNRNWHYMWSKFYYYKKNYNYIYALIKTIKHFISALIKTIFYIKINEKKHFIYLNRLKGLISSYLGKPSFRRPKI